MSEEKIKPSRYELENIVSNIGYLDGQQRSLVKAALNIHLSRLSKIGRTDTNEMLMQLENARLIGSSSREAIIKKIFEKKEV